LIIIDWKQVLTSTTDKVSPKIPFQKLLHSTYLQYWHISGLRFGTEGILTNQAGSQLFNLTLFLWLQHFSGTAV